MDVWRQPFTSLRAPILVDLLADPFENAFDNAPAWEKWYIDRAFLILPAVRGRQLHGDLQGLPAAPAAILLLDRPGDGKGQRVDEGALMMKALIAFAALWLANGSGALAQAQLANPASQRCIQEGGMLQIEQRPDGGQFGVCVFTDNRQCEEWALFRVECPVAGCGSRAI